jgi:hypothetical protein
LMELPDSVTKLTWDNAVMVSPNTAAALGVTDRMLATLSIDGRSVRVAVVLTPGQAAGSLKLYFGYGRTAAGRVGGDEENPEAAKGVGVNAYRLRSKQIWSFARGAKLEPSSDRYKLAMTQDKHSIDRIGKFGTADRLPQLVREATLTQYEEHPDFAKHVRGPSLGDEHRPQQVHRLQRLRGGLPGGEQHPGRRQGPRVHGPRDAVAAHRSLLQG